MKQLFISRKSDLGHIIDAAFIFNRSFQQRDLARNNQAVLRGPRIEQDEDVSIDASGLHFARGDQVPYRASKYLSQIDSIRETLELHTNWERARRVSLGPVFLGIYTSAMAGPCE